MKIGKTSAEIARRVFWPASLNRRDTIDLAICMAIASLGSLAIIIPLSVFTRL